MTHNLQNFLDRYGNAVTSVLFYGSALSGVCSALFKSDVLVAATYFLYFGCLLWFVFLVLAYRLRLWSPK